MNGRWKRYRVLLIAAGMAVCMTAGLVIGITWSRSHTEEMIIQAADKKMTLTEKDGNESGDDSEALYFTVGAQEDALYKDAVADEEIVREVCKKYGLDYDTVQVKDITRDMRNYEEALWLRKNMGKCPLLAENVKEEDVKESLALASMEVYICDIYAFNEGKAVIERMCKEFGINPQEAFISDLTAEQLVQIGEEAYETSDHPKGDDEEESEVSENQEE